MMTTGTITILLATISELDSNDEDVHGDDDGLVVVALLLLLVSCRGGASTCGCCGRSGETNFQLFMFVATFTHPPTSTEGSAAEQQQQ